MRMEVHESVLCLVLADIDHECNNVSVFWLHRLKYFKNIIRVLCYLPRVPRSAQCPSTSAMPRQALRLKCMHCKKKEIRADDLQRHKFSCLRHAFAAVRLQQARLRQRNSGDDANNSSGVGDANERQTENPLLNDESASRLAAAEMEESWRTWYESRGRRF